MSTVPPEDRPAKGWVRTLTLVPPTLSDNTADLDRLLNALKIELNCDHLMVEFSLMRKLPSSLRKWGYRITCVLFKDGAEWILVDIVNPADKAVILGVAVDLGTTRVVLRLLNLIDGKTISELAFDNPQIRVGADVLTRIHSAENEGGLELLTSLITSSMDQHIVELCRSCGRKPEDIYLMSLAGNTAMTHLFLGLEPRWIIREPYIPAANRLGVLPAAQLGLPSIAGAHVLIFPNVGSYFGGDLIAGILFAGLNQQEETAILVDVGTNAEVVLGNRDWLMACAGAAGPALEGGVTRMGMLAGPGVIDRVRIDPENHQFDIHTIFEKPAIGICGSGVIDLAAQLYVSGLVDIRGKLMRKACGDRYMEKDGLAHLVVVPKDQSGTGRDLYITQADLDSLIRSKAAMYTILETITQTVGIDQSQLTRFYVAGTFGSFIDPQSAITIGMIPDLPLESYISLGNSSLGGCTRVLQDVDAIEEIDKIRDSITYMELNVNQDFMNRFSAAKFIPHTDPGRFPSVKGYGQK